MVGNLLMFEETFWKKEENRLRFVVWKMEWKWTWETKNLKRVAELACVKGRHSSSKLKGRPCARANLKTDLTTYLT